MDAKTGVCRKTQWTQKQCVCRTLQRPRSTSGSPAAARRPQTPQATFQRKNNRWHVGAQNDDKIQCNDSSKLVLQQKVKRNQ